MTFYPNFYKVCYDSKSELDKTYFAKYWLKIQNYYQIIYYLSCIIKIYIYLFL